MSYPLLSRASVPLYQGKDSWICVPVEAGDSQSLDWLTVQQVTVLSIVKSQVAIYRVKTHINGLACIGNANVVQMWANGDLTYLGYLVRPGVAGQELIDTS
jgi:hypothetical protein